MNALLERLGLFVSRHRWWVLGVWVLLLLGAIWRQPGRRRRLRQRLHGAGQRVLERARRAETATSPRPAATAARSSSTPRGQTVAAKTSAVNKAMTNVGDARTSSARPTR